MEQYLQTARSQAVARGAGAELFDFEYRRWLDEDRQLAAELASGQLPGHDLRATVDECLAHYDEIFQLRATAASSDVFHVITGAWAAPPERCFLWIGGFRPSQILKMLTRQLDPLTELQLTWVRSLWESSQLAEAALSGRLVEVQLSLSHVIAGGSADVAVALDKLSDLRGLLLQADNLRQQTLHEVREILTVRQAAWCFMAISEYHDRIRSLGSLWATHSRQ